MRINPSYQKIKLEDACYLIPFGQSRADQRRAIRLNPSGELVWSCLEQNLSQGEMLARYMEAFGLPASEKESAKADITAFLQELSFQGILLPDAHSEEDFSSPASLTLLIAGLRVQISGAHDTLSDALRAFAADPDQTPPDQQALILLGLPAARENGELLLRNEELTVIGTDETFILLFPPAFCVRELHLTKDGRLARLYCVPPKNPSPEGSFALTEDVSHALRFAFLYLAARRGLYALHSASVLHDGRAWLFSAPSGTGKSTHAAHWQNLFGALPLNGDLNLLGMKDGRPFVFGLPWCGTSGIFTRDAHELGGIFFLKQAPQNQLLAMSGDEKLLRLANRIISPTWTDALLKDQIDALRPIAASVYMKRLLCTKEPDSAVLAQGDIPTH